MLPGFILPGHGLVGSLMNKLLDKISNSEVPR